ncbi:MAG: hypothetical protein K1X57_09350 [Gemmataceae bacterium]|nr:hypothetical protein [Gemmataceae bacterium]
MAPRSTSRKRLRLTPLEPRVTPAVSYLTPNSVYSQNFNGLPASGTIALADVATPIDLSTSPISATGMATGDWFLLRTAGTTMFAIDDGNATAGGALSYGPSATAERSLGLLASGAGVASVGAMFTNNTGDSLSQFTITFVGEQWRRGDGAANKLSFSYSLGATSIAAGTFTPAPSLDFTAPVTTGANLALDGNAIANQSAVSATVSGITWAKGQTLAIRWDDVDDAGQDDGLAIDALTFTASRESQVNTTTAGAQRTTQGGRSVAMDGAGNTLVVWQSNGQDGSGYGIYGQRFNASGAKVDSEFLVNTYTTNAQINPTVAMNAAGQAIVTWQSFGQDGANYGIYAQRYDAAGNKSGGEIAVNTGTASIESNPSVAIDGDGDAVVTWMSFFQDGSSWGVYGQRFDNTGAKVGSEFLVNTSTALEQSYPAVAMDLDGDFVTVWQASGQDGNQYGIFGQRFDKVGAKLGGEFPVNSTTNGNQYRASISMTAAGDFAVVWTSNEGDGSVDGVFGQRLNANGAKLGGEFAVNTFTTNHQSFPSVAMTAQGDAIVTWMSLGQDGSGHGIFAQRFGLNGSKVGDEFAVNSFTTGTQAYSSVAINALGDAVVVWQSAGQDGDSYGVYARRYAPPPPVPGAEFIVNTTTKSSQRKDLTRQVALDGQGRAWAVWHMSAGGGTIRAQQLSLSGQRIGGELQFSTNAFGYAPAVAANAAGDAVIVWASSNGSLKEIVGQRLSPSGALIGSPFTVTSTSSALFLDDPSVAIDTAGGFTVVWTYRDSAVQSDVYGQRYDATGSKVGGSFIVNTFTSHLQQHGQIAMDAAGDSVIVWESGYQDGSEFGIYGQRFEASGSKVGSEFRVNTDTLGQQLYPSVALDADGDAIVVWETTSDIVSVAEIHGQRLSSLGLLTGPEFTVNSYSTSNQQYPSVAMDAVGNAIVVWQSQGQDDYLDPVEQNSGVYGQRYAAAGNRIGTEFRVNRYSTGYQALPSVASDASGNTIAVWESFLQDGDSTGIIGRWLIGPTVESIRVNDGSAQRSRVTSLTVTFNTTVTLAPGAFQLARTGPGSPATVTCNVDTSASTPTQTIATLTFSGPQTQFGSLIDGLYTLAITGFAFTDAAGVEGLDSMLSFHRLFGDSDGNRTVDSTDLLAFRLAFLGTGPTFDFDGNGTVDATDFLQFRLHFLQTI